MNTIQREMRDVTDRSWRRGFGALRPDDRFHFYVATGSFGFNMACDPPLGLGRGEVPVEGDELCSDCLRIAKGLNR